MVSITLSEFSRDLKGNLGNLNSKLSLFLNSLYFWNPFLIPIHPLPHTYFLYSLIYLAETIIQSVAQVIHLWFLSSPFPHAISHWIPPKCLSSCVTCSILTAAALRPALSLSFSHYCHTICSVFLVASGLSFLSFKPAFVLLLGWCFDVIIPLTCLKPPSHQFFWAKSPISSILSQKFPKGGWSPCGFWAPSPSKSSAVSSVSSHHHHRSSSPYAKYCAENQSSHLTFTIVRCRGGNWGLGKFSKIWEARLPTQHHWDPRTSAFLSFSPKSRSSNSQLFAYAVLSTPNALPPTLPVYFQLSFNILPTFHLPQHFFRNQLFPYTELITL